MIVESILTIAERIDATLWGPWTMIFIAAVSVYLTLRSGAFQLRGFVYILRNTLGRLQFGRKGGPSGQMTPFQATSTALASTVGTGNIAGVATALSVGGPGAIFWMWLLAILGMMSKTAEITLAVHYRDVEPDGRTHGGPMYYIQKGLGWSALAKLFSLGIFINSMVAATLQSHTVGRAFLSTYDINPYLVTGMMAVVTAIVVLGGMRRIGQFSEALVPLMSAVFIASGLFVFFANLDAVPEVLSLIFRHAFSPAPALGGFAGAAVSQTIQVGMSRGMLSNEAGLGTAPIAHATATTEHPFQQGMWGAFEVSIDTLVICTISAFAVLSTGVLSSGESGIELVIIAFASVFSPELAGGLLSFAILTFCLTTQIAFFVYFETAASRASLVRETDRALLPRWIYLVPGVLFAGVDERRPALGLRQHRRRLLRPAELDRRPRALRGVLHSDARLHERREALRYGRDRRLQGVHTMSRIPLIAAAAALAAGLLHAEDWPQWRGPSRDGVATASPAEWPDALSRTWTLEVGTGHASPVVVGSKVYLFSREGESEVLRAIDLRSGEPSWRSAYEAPYEMDSAATFHGKGPKATPLVTGGRIFTAGISGFVSAHDQATGARLWQIAPEGEPLYGHAASPMLAGGKLVVHTGGHHDGAIRALDPATGRTLWSYGDDGPGYASPVTAGDGSGVLFTQTDAHIVGLRLTDGEELLRVPFVTPYDQNSVTPVVVEDTIVFAGLDQRTVARSLDELESEAWRSRVTFYMSSPVLLGDRLVGFSNQKSGHFVVLDATSGDTLWEGTPRQGDNAALVVVGERVLSLTDDGVLRVWSWNGEALLEERSYEVSDSPTWAHPVPVENGVLIKDEATLSLWSTRP